jgi:hypothetical protein
MADERIASRSRAVGLVAAALVALVAAGVALAASPTKEKIRFTKAGQAQAKAEVLRKRDLGAGWRGGAKKPDLSSTFPDCNYRPKQSDLVLNGAAETAWQQQLSAIDGEVQVLQTARMVRLDWQRTVLAPQVTPCLRRSFAKGVAQGGKVVSFGQVAFPRVAKMTRAYRGVLQLSGLGRFEIDVVAFGARRNELTLTVSGPSSASASLRKTELRLARLLVARLR